MCIRRGGERKGKQPQTDTTATEVVRLRTTSSMATTSTDNNNNTTEDVFSNNNNNIISFKEKSEEIEKKKMEMKGRVQLHLNRIDEETKRLATIRQELEALSDPMHKELSVMRKRLDSVDKELKSLELNAQKKEKEYKDTLDAFNEKNKEKVQLVTRLMELVGESEKMRMEKLEELSKSIEPVQ